MVQVVNVVASGSLNTELDLQAVATKINDIVTYEPSKYSGAYFRFNNFASLVVLHQTGKYIITGAESIDDASATRVQFLELLAENSILETPEDTRYSVQNFVCTADLDRSLNLNALAIGLGLEQTEYEPEQFPGLIFHPANTPSVVLLFTSGNLVITGCPTVETAETVYESLRSQIESLLPAE